MSSTGLGISSVSGAQGDELDEEELEIDHVFMEEYRSQRLKEMQNNLPVAGKKSMNPNTDPKAVSLLRGPVFGECVESGGEGWFLKEVEEEDPRATIVVHIYNPRDAVCSAINEYMDSIAASWSHIKFVKLQAQLCGIHIDPNKLPIISIYKDKNLISTIKDFKDDLLGRGSGVCTKEDVEWLLESSDNWPGAPQDY